MASLEELRATRLAKLRLLRETGIDPYPAETRRTHTIVEALGQFAVLAKSKKTFSLVGRVRALRPQGALIFLDIDDGTGRGQALFKKEELAKTEFELFRDSVDVGDFVELTGTLFLTSRKEKTLLVKSWRMLGKSLRPLPDKWHGLADVEERFRRRYLDTLMNPKVKERFLLRSRIVAELRTRLEEAGYLEIETPVFQPVPGGATARPFITHHNALGVDLYLRVSDELYLKRLLIGGFPKVYEIGRDFRNEGIDVTHNPEFTMLEFYEAYATAGSQRSFVEELLRALVKKIFQKTKIPYQEAMIDWGAKFKVLGYFDLLKRVALVSNPENINRKDLALRANQLGVAIDPADGKEKIMDAIYKKICRPKLVQPTFIVDYPKDYLPLAKSLPAKPQLVDAFQLVAGGVELVKAFSELNDPIDQRARFETQEKFRQAGDEEAQRLDEDFIEALEYGMPPAGGVGIGIDRLVMLLTNTTNIREVIFFPILRPK